MCRKVYSPQGANLVTTQTSFQLWNFRVFYNNWNATLETALANAEKSWAVAPGPQAPTQPVTNTTGLLTTSSFYYRCTQAPNPGGLPACGNAIALTCLVENMVRQCDASAPRNVDFTLMFTNHSVFMGLMPASRQEGTMAHEMGHALGLSHHPVVTCLMFPDNVPARPNSPQACDLGRALPLNVPPVAPCDSFFGSGPEDFGIRCIYQWWREQPGTDVDCADPNRDGVVAFADFLIVLQSFNQPPGSPEYHPDTDFDRNGSVGFTDFLTVTRQMGDICGPPDHYEHS